MIQKSVGARPSLIAVRYQFEDFAVSWAGQGRDVSEFCFGSEDGRLKFTSVEGVETDETVCGDEQREAVNGVAFNDRFIAVSSRAAVTFWASFNGEQWRCSRFPCGAHGVIATKAGQFVAPLGPTGLMKAEPAQGGEPAVAVSRIRSADRTLDYYKVIYLDSAGCELLACAVRSFGVAVLDLSQGLDGGQIKSVSVPTLDFVDMCSLVSPSNPRAAAAVARNGALLLFKDLLDDAPPAVVKFDDIKGVAYRVLSAFGSVLLLTNVGLYVLHGLAKRFLEGENVASTPTLGQIIPIELGEPDESASAAPSTPTLGQIIPIEAVDANICSGRWLLAVIAEGCLRFDLTALLGESTSSTTDEDQTLQSIRRSPTACAIEEPYESQASRLYKPHISRQMPISIMLQSQVLHEASLA